MSYLAERDNRINAQRKVASLGNMYANNFDTGTTQGLLNLAQAKGGMVGEVANELSNPTTSILSTIGNGFKNAFGHFVDAISFTGEVSAGVLLSLADDNNLTLGANIRKAIKEDIQPGEALFGDVDKNLKGLNKIGAYAVRFATDIALDPLTYLTFGTARGILGLSSAPKITTGHNLAKSVIGKTKGLKSGRLVALNENVGDDLLKYYKLKAEGREPIELLKSLKTRFKKLGVKGFKDVDGKFKNIDDIIKHGEDELFDFQKEFIKLTSLNDKLTPRLAKILNKAGLKNLNDYARKSMTDLLEAFPQLSETVLDKGGIKFFGQTILESAKINMVRNAIPGVKYLGKSTEQFRMALAAPFNTNLQKIDGTYKYKIREVKDFRKTLETVIKEMNGTTGEMVERMFSKNGIRSLDEKNIILKARIANKRPEVLSHQRIYDELGGIKGDARALMLATGRSTSLLQNHNFMFQSREEISKMAKKDFKNKGFGAKPSSAKEKMNVVFESIDEPTKVVVRGEKFEPLNLKKTREAITSGSEEFGSLTTKQLDASVDRYVKGIDNEIKIAKESSLYDNAADLIEHKKDIIEQKGGEGLHTFLDKDTGNLFFRRGATYEELFGKGNVIEGFTKPNIEDVDLLGSLVTGIQKQQAETLQSVYADGLAAYGRKASLAPNGWEKLDIPNLPGNFLSRDGKEILFSPHVKDSIEVMIKQTRQGKMDNAYFEAYDKVQSLWKVSVTSLFPAFHMRNGVSNVFLNFMDIGVHAFNPKYWGQSADLMLKERRFQTLTKTIHGSSKSIDEIAIAKKELERLNRTIVLIDNTGAKHTWAELRGNLVQKDVVFTRGFQEHAVDLGTEEGLISVGKNKGKYNLNKINPFSQQFIPFEVGKGFGSTVETHGRLINFLANFEKTGDVTLAATRTKQFLFDYSDLTKFEKETMRRIIPFYSFSRKNLEVQAKAIMQTPGRVGAEVKLLETFNDMFSQVELTDEQKDLFPDWMIRGFTAYKKAQNGTLRVMSGFELPIQQPFEQMQAQNLFGGISPLIRVPVEQMSGYDFYRGKQLQDVTNASAYKHYPQFVKKFIGYHEQTWVDPKTGKKVKWSTSLRPHRMHLLNNLPPTSRVINSIQNISGEEKSIQDKLLRELLGIRSYDADLEKLEIRKEKEEMESIIQLLDSSGMTYTFDRTIIKKETKEELGI